MPWTKSNSNPIGLDLGGSTIRALQVRATSAGFAVDAAAQALAVECKGKTPAERVLANGSVIRNLLKSERFKGHRAVLAYPLCATRIKNFRLPCMPDEELQQAVEFEAKERFQSLDDSPEIRFYNAGRVEGGQGSQFELIVLGIRGDELRDYIAAVEDLGLDCEAIDFSPAAMFRPFGRFLKRDEDATQVNAFLDLGHEGSRFVMTCGTEINFVKLIDVGTRDFQQAMANRFSLESQEARQLYANFVEGYGGHEDGQQSHASLETPAVLEAIKPAVELLSKEIGICMRYFSVTFRGLRTDSITCVGGASMQPEILTSIGEAAGVPARMGHPLRNIDTRNVFTGSDRRNGQPDWATVLGLAMREPQNEQDDCAAQEAVAS